MLAQFTVGNFRSIKEPISLTLTTTRLKSRYEEINSNNTFAVSSKTSLVKSAVIYGANASGKSNLIRAFAFMRRFVINSSRESQATDPIAVEPFLLENGWGNQPSFFEVIFYINDVLYRYGFEADKKKIHREWLFQTVKQEAKVFIREYEKEKINMTQAFRRSDGRNLDEITRHNALFLSVLAQWKSSLGELIFNWFKTVGVISGIHDVGYKLFTMEEFKSNVATRKDIIRFMQEMDLGIQNIDVTELDISQVDFPVNIPKDLKTFLLESGSSQHLVSTKHEKYDENGTVIGYTEFELEEHESAGTQKAFALSGVLFQTLRNGEVLFIDELDARFHPLITQSVIKLFNSNKTNPKNAQLIFVTHDTSHLSNKLFRRDQIWFTEKNQYGATDLYSLSDFRIRNDASYETDYILGKYGGLPFLGDTEMLIDFDGSPIDA